MEKQMSVQVLNLTRTTSEWESTTDIIPKGLLCIEESDDGIIKAKVGDGTKSFNELDYLNSDLYNNLQNQINEKGIERWTVTVGSAGGNAPRSIMSIKISELTDLSGLLYVSVCNTNDDKTTTYNNIKMIGCIIRFSINKNEDGNGTLGSDNTTKMIDVNEFSYLDLLGRSKDNTNSGYSENTNVGYLVPHMWVSRSAEWLNIGVTIPMGITGLTLNCSLIQKYSMNDTYSYKAGTGSSVNNQNVQALSVFPGGSNSDYGEIGWGSNQNYYTIKAAVGKFANRDAFAEVFNDYKNNTADGQYSSSSGFTTSASGDYSQTRGWKTTTTTNAIGGSAEGYGTTSDAESSHAEGELCQAKAYGSHAENIGTVASSEAQHAQGSYNIEDADGEFLHIVGNGTDDEHRSNAQTLDWAGNLWNAGNTKSRSFDGTNDIGLLETNASSVSTMGYTCKNLLENTSPLTLTHTGITYTVDTGSEKNGNINVNGTHSSNDEFSFYQINKIRLKPGTYILSGCPSGGSTSNGYYLAVYNSNWSNIAIDTGNGAKFTIGSDDVVRVRIMVMGDVTISNKKFYPMVRHVDIEDGTYEQYKDSIQKQINYINSIVGYNRYNNLLQYATRYGYMTTQYGVTMEVKSDGSIVFNGTCSGTSNGYTDFSFITSQEILPYRNYILSGCPEGGGTTTYRLLIIDSDKWNNIVYDNGTSAKWYSNMSKHISVRIRMYEGNVCDNLTFYPMLRFLESNEGFEPPIHTLDQFVSSNVSIIYRGTLIGTNVNGGNSLGTGDFNNCIKAGVYSYRGCPLNHPGTDTGISGPGYYGLLFVLSSGGTQIVQLAFSIDSVVPREVYMRSTHNSGTDWSKWEKISTSNDNIDWTKLESSYTGTTTDIYYKKDGDTVNIRGSFTPSTSTGSLTNLLTVPSNIRPTNFEVRSTNSTGSGNCFSVSIGTDGVMSIGSASQSTFTANTTYYLNTVYCI